MDHAQTQLTLFMDEPPALEPANDTGVVAPWEALDMVLSQPDPGWQLVAPRMEMHVRRRDGIEHTLIIAVPRSL
ncbi:hypothetical protein [Flaviflagellibacter deserti]|uniref:Uncharacterized protein n=1 Tax=Flaviflagellibacter deserti TaxID=2267266 RepID=A0ABV9YUP8_9HYPH